MLQTGDQLPEWQLTTLHGEPAPALSSLRGRPILLLFWGLGCPGCKTRALPVTRQMQEQYPELHLVGVHSPLDGPKYSPRQINEMQLLHRLSYPMYQDSDDNATFKAYGAEGTPHWILIDEEGKLLRSVFGSMPGHIQRLDYLLRERFGQ